MDKVEPEHIRELTHTVEMAQQGYWMPLAVVCLLFSIIIFLLVAQWVNYKKSNNARHADSEARLKQSEEQISLLTTIAAELKVDKENKDREIRDLKVDVRVNKEDIKDFYKR
jgi:large-conductance mechanosensitive channel